MSCRWIIIGSAPDSDLSCVLPLVAAGVPVICADGGAQYAEKTGIVPSFYIGDSDSGEKPKDVDGIVLPTEKDYTDLHSAILWAVDHGGKELYITGCTNGRADHYFANVFLLEMISDLGARGVIMDAQNRIFYHSSGSFYINKKENYELWKDESVEVSKEFKYVSVIPIDSKIEGVTLCGMKYALDNAELTRKCPIGVSNEMVSTNCEIRIKCGKCLVILSKDVK